MKYSNACLVFSLSTLLASCSPGETEMASMPTSSNAEPIALSLPPENVVSIGTIDRLQSSVLGEERELWVYLPPSAESEDNNQKYPVVYLLDGNGHFHSVSGMIHQLSTVNGNKVSPEMIVVGIPNTDRMRDLTPTHTEGTTGGGTQFLDFIETEVIPHVEANYPASQYRTFIGHSLGGLMAIEALVERPELFDNYIAIDPSLWWDDRAILRKAEAAVREKSFSGKSLFVTIANTMREGITIDTVRSDENDQTNHIRSILQFVETADASTSHQLDFAWKYYDDDTHGSVPLISEYDAIRFLFPWYNPNTEVSRYFNPELPDSPEAVIDIIDAHFDDVSARFGYEFLPPQRWVNQQASSFRSNDKTATALALLTLNVRNYPGTASTHEALGDLYVTLNDPAAARTHFEHALARGTTIDIAAKLAAAVEPEQ